METVYSQQQVIRSIEKFDDLSSDLQWADFRTFQDKLARLMHFSSVDPVMSTITLPMLDRSFVNIDKWLEDFEATRGSFIGSGRFRLPVDDNERLALLYQLLDKFSKDERSFLNFGVLVLGQSKTEMVVSTFSQQILQPLFRDLRKMLRDLIEKIAGCEEVPASALPVINIGAYIQIAGDVSGGYINAAGSMGQSSATIENNIIEELDLNIEDVLQELKALRQELVSQAQDDPKKYAEIGKVAEAEMAASKNDKKKLISCLRGFSKWTIDTAIKIGIPVVTDIIKNELSIQ